jgi:hypothetical protein
MINETFIPFRDIEIRLKSHSDLTDKDKKEFGYITDMLKMSNKRKEKVFKPVIKNQQKNQNK